MIFALCLREKQRNKQTNINEIGYWRLKGVLLGRMT